MWSFSGTAAGTRHHRGTGTAVRAAAPGVPGGATIQPCVAAGTSRGPEPASLTRFATRSSIAAGTGRAPSQNTQSATGGWPGL